MTLPVRQGLWRLAALALVTVQLPVLARTAADPSQSDFANYFTPAFVLARGGQIGLLYDRDRFDEAMAAAGLSHLGSFVPHPPANALWLLPLAACSPGNAKILWTGALLVTIVLLIRGVMGLAPGLTPTMATVLVLAPTLAIRNGLAFGQPYLILAAWLISGVLALQRGRSFAGGLLLGLGVSFKPQAFTVGFLFMDPGRRRVFAGFVCGAVGPSVALGVLTGAEPFAEFCSKVLPWALRGDIQDPFSAGWGSAMALANRLFRSEPDLNPAPWLDAPLFARFLGSAVSATFLVLGVFSGRRAIAGARPLDGVGICVACALGAAPFVASYHLVLLIVPILAVALKLRGRALFWWILCWALLGSPLVNTFRAASGLLAPLAFARLFGILGLALVAAWPFLDRRLASKAIAIGLLAGVLALPWGSVRESWPPIQSAKGYSMMRPHFCGRTLRWFVPSPDGRRLEIRNEGGGCAPEWNLSRTGSAVLSRFTEGSWNIYLRRETSNGAETRLTFSDANEIDPVLAPDGCAVIFASDQGRGLGSTALYRLDVSGLMDGCGPIAPGAGPH